MIKTRDPAMAGLAPASTGASSIPPKCLPLYVDCRRAMTDDFPFHQVNNIFCNVRCMIRDPLQMTRSRKQGEAGFDHFRRGTHGCYEFVDDVIVVAVYLIVEPAHRPRELRVQIYKRV